MNLNKELWEILVPASNNKDKNFTYAHHKKWDAFVKELTGGVTIMKTSKGQWVTPTGQLYIDRMIPCRIICTQEQMENIVQFTIEYYDQEAVLAYRISDNVILQHKTEVGRPYKPIKFVCIDEENNIWENIYCKLKINPYTCGRQWSCKNCPNLNDK